MKEDDFAVNYIDLPLSVFAVAALERGKTVIMINKMLNAEQRKIELEKIMKKLIIKSAPEAKCER